MERAGGWWAGGFRHNQSYCPAVGDVRRRKTGTVREITLLGKSYAVVSPSLALVKVIEAHAILCDGHQMAQEPTDNATGAAETVQLCAGKDGVRSHLLTVGETAGAVPPLEEPRDWKEMEAIIERKERNATGISLAGGHAVLCRNDSNQTDYI